MLLEMVELSFMGCYSYNKIRICSLLGVCLLVSIDKFCKAVFTDKMWDSRYSVWIRI